MIKQLKDYKLIAQGGQAEIFEVNEKQVLRVLRNPSDEMLLKNEMTAMQILKEQGLCVPEVYEYLKIDGKPALLIERVYGGSMLDQIMKTPHDISAFSDKLAEIHTSIGKYDAPLSFLAARKRASFLIDKTELLKPEYKSFLFTLIEQVPDGSSICHGDFHPGNILVSQDKYFILDWFGVNRGDIISDIAHSYLLMKTIPRLPGMGAEDYLLLKKAANTLSDKYLGSIKKGQEWFNEDLFSKWLAIKAGERVVFGSSLERDGLIDFIDKCYCVWQDKTENLSWFEFL